MIRTTVAIGLIHLLAAGAAAQPAGDETGFTSLFNGKDLAGWTVKCKPADKDFACWKVDNGTILADSMDVKKHDYIWLLSEKEYGDFILRFRFQAYRDSKGNTGVQVRSRYDDAAGWLDGPQVDIHPPQPWRTGMIWDETRGVQRWLWPDVPKGKWVDESMAVKRKFFFSDDDPAWNEMEIRCQGTKLAATLNGTVVMEYDGKGVLDDETHQKRNTGMKGHIALQIHTGDQLRVRFKDIRVKSW